MGAIVWLASYPKSGNTWMRAFLHNLLTNPDQPVHINELDRFSLGDSHRSWYAEVSKTPLEQLSDAEIIALKPAAHRRMTQAFPDSVFVKTHNRLGLAYGHPLITLDCTAGAIYVLRNPLDVVVSMAHHYAVGLDQAIAMLNDSNLAPAATELIIPQFLGDWSGHVRSWTTAPNAGLKVVRYEDMLSRPVATFGAVAGFLGLKPPRQRLAKAIEFSSFKVLHAQEDAGGFKERAIGGENFFRVGRAGQWRGRLSARQIDAVVSAHGGEMEGFDYLP